MCCDKMFSHALLFCLESFLFFTAIQVRAQRAGEYLLPRCCFTDEDPGFSRGEQSTMNARVISKTKPRQDGSPGLWDPCEGSSWYPLFSGMQTTAPCAPWPCVHSGTLFIKCFAWNQSSSWRAPFSILPWDSGEMSEAKEENISLDLFC